MAILFKWRTPGIMLVGALLIVLTLACGGGSRHIPQGSLQVFNDGSLPMVQLFVARSSSSTWSVDQLAPNALLPGDSITLTRLDPDNYDVQAFFSDGSSDEVFDAAVFDGVNTVIGMKNTGNGAVAVVNNSPFTINGIYLTPTSAPTWGPNQTDAPLDPGKTLTLDGIAPDIYDLRVIFTNGSFADTPSIQVTSGTTATIQVN